jgi:hypothetical protein
MNRLEGESATLNHPRVNEPCPDVPPVNHIQPGGCAKCATDQKLRLLKETLISHGLDVHGHRFPYDEHLANISVINPNAPERGMLHIERDGCVRWDYDGSLDDAGIPKIVSEVVTILRAPLPRRERSKFVNRYPYLLGWRFWAYIIVAAIVTVSSALGLASLIPADHALQTAEFWLFLMAGCLASAPAAFTPPVRKFWALVDRRTKPNDY